jgi:zinc protease
VRQALVTDLLVQQMERQLLHLQQQPSRPFIHAEVGRGRIVRPLSVVGAEMIAWPDSLERALGTVLAEVERIAQHGLPPEVLERRKAALLRGLEGQAASAGTRSSATYVEEYAQNYLDPEGPLLSADQELTLAREIVPRITPEALAEAARFWRAGKGVKVIVSLPKFAHVRPPTRQSVLAVFDSIRRTPLAPVSGSAAVAEGPLMEQPPAPGRIVAETLHAGAGITEWRLSNGARVLFKPTQNDPDELLIRAWSPGGFSRVPDSLFYGPGRMAAYMMTEAAGLGKLDRDDLRQELATTGVRDFRVDIGYADEAIELAGSPREVETLFQMLHLQFTAPKLDTAALSAWSSNAKYQTRDVSIHDMLNQAFARGNPRLMPVQTQLAELVKVDEALAVYRDRFGNAGDFTFMLVGAATAEQVKPLVERYIASLPATDARETPKDPDVRPLIGAIRLNEKVVPVPRSETLLAFDGSFPTEPAEYLGERQRLSALTLVLERRLRDRLREQLGGTYGVAVEGGTYRLYGEHFRVLVFFQSAPERMRELSREMWGILDSVRTRGATAAELAMAVRMQRRQLETQLQSNQFWLERMQLYNRLGVPLDRIVSPYPADHVTPKELEAAAGKYLPKTAFIQLTNVPSDSTMRAGKDSLDRAGGLSSRR